MGFEARKNDQTTAGLACFEQAVRLCRAGTAPVFFPHTDSYIDIPPLKNGIGEGGFRPLKFDLWFHVPFYGED